MTGNKLVFTSLDENLGGFVTFSDGSKLQVQGIGNNNTLGINQLQNFLYFEGLKANLIRISQLCDDQHIVHFTKMECNIFEKLGDFVFKGKNE